METILHAKIRGTEPILMNAPTGIGVPRSSKRVSSYDPQVEAEAALYRDSNGTICIPNLVILAALREAAKEHKAPGRGRKTLKTFIMAGLRIRPEMIPIDPQEWSIDERPVVVQRARVLRWRPRFEEWSLAFDIAIVDEATITPTAVRNILEDAGRFVGLCDFRPLFGTFEVEELVDTATGVAIR